MSWFKANQLSLNLSKTEIINFWEHQNQSSMNLNGTEIPIVPSTKFLGVHIDHNLTWTTHMNQLHNKLMTSKLLLSTNHNLLNTRCLRSIYFAHIYSHLTCGLITWGPMSQKKAIKDLARIQDMCIHLVCKELKFRKVDPLYWKLHTLRLPELIDLELVKYGYKITNRLYPGKIHTVAESNGGLK